MPAYMLRMTYIHEDDHVSCVYHVCTVCLRIGVCFSFHEAISKRLRSSHGRDMAEGGYHHEPIIAMLLRHESQIERYA